MAFKFPELPYSTNALEPYIDAATMDVHYNKHHKAYFEKFSAAIAKTDAKDKSLESILKSISRYPLEIRNNAGGYYNHNVFWESMSPQGGESPRGALAEGIQKKWGSFEAFQKDFEKASLSLFGSGFTWLILNEQKELEITTTPNQDNPLMDVADKRGQPLLALDLWEHAYYLHYQNKRPEYVGAWWNIVNWSAAEAKFSSATSLVEV